MANTGIDDHRYSPAAAWPIQKPRHTPDAATRPSAIHVSRSARAFAFAFDPMYGVCHPMPSYEGMAAPSATPGFVGTRGNRLRYRAFWVYVARHGPTR